MKRAIRAIVLCMAVMMVLSGCEVVSVNREKDLEQVVAEVGGTKILKKEIYDDAQAVLTADDIDIYDENMSSDLRASINEYLKEQLDARIDEVVLEKMAEKMEITLTEEEIKESDEEVEETLGLMRMYYLGYDEDNPDEYEGDIEADLDELMQQQGYDSAEAYKTEYRQQKINTKLQEEATKDVTSTEEEVKARYDTDLKAQKDVFATAETEEEAEIPAPTEEATSPLDEGAEDAADEDPDTQYQTLSGGGSNGSGTYVLFKPAGYRLVKHVLLELVEEDTKAIEAIDEKISEINNEISPIQTELSTAESAKTEAEGKIEQLKGEAEEEEQDPAVTSPADEPEADPTASGELDVANMTEEEKTKAIEEQQKIVDEQTKTIEDLNKKLAPYQTQLSDAEEEKEAARKKGAENLQPTIDKIIERYNNGEEFDALIEEYNTDPGMKEGPNKEYGYLITPDGAGFVEEFSTAALALSKVGDISDPVQSDHGVHIIRLEYDDNEAELPYEKVQSVVKDKVEDDKKTELWTELTETTWPEEIGVKKYDSRLDFIK